jgi:flagellum-specific peptidoglycan hydrolase FlgJ
VSCGTKKRVVNSSIKKNPKQTVAVKKLPSVKQKEHVKMLVKKNLTLNKYTLTYIKKYAPLAVLKMHEYKIPASITLAQGILESGNGRSLLASKSNNHFGIKCHRGWTGQKVYHDDDKKDDCFRKYTYVEHSYNDHSEFLTGRKRYAFLFKLRATDYKSWAKGLKKAGYATDKKYPKKLIKIIEDYQLYDFDTVKKRDLKKDIATTKKTTKKTVSSKMSVYVVEKGDTLYSIAKKHKMTVNALQKMNHLKNTNLSIGQELNLK